MSKARKEIVCVIGLGVIGLPVAQHVKKHYRTVGWDLERDACERAIKKGVPSGGWNSGDKPFVADIYVVAVNTWFRNAAPDMSAVWACCQEISEWNPNSLVCFESTLYPGTARSIAERFGLKHVVVCPHRYWSEDPENYGVTQLRVFGALNPASREEGRIFYSELGIPLHLLSSLEMAEATKIVENSHRYLQIAYAEEMRVMAEKNGLNFDELRESVNTKWNVKIPLALRGIGGTCLPKDIQYLLSLYPSPLLLGALKADEDYREFLSMAPLPKNRRKTLEAQ